MRSILDSGYVKLVEHWGSDERIIEAARMSTAKGFEGWGPVVSDAPCEKCDAQGVVDDSGFALRGQPFFDTKPCPKCEGDKRHRAPGDEKLLRYLWEHKHATPFEMAGAIFEIKAPIMVFREWHRHRTQSYAEMSARYVPLPSENYVPTVERVLSGARTAGTNKQAQGRADVTEPDALSWLAQLADVYEHAQHVYEQGIALGIPKELARLPVPVARYSRMRASAVLRNWLAFLSLRMDSAAQWEIRQFAQAVHDELAVLFPRTLSLFDERKGAI